ncbi:MAG: type VI secretion system membrane subunit TssM [Nitrospira sp.]
MKRLVALVKSSLVALAGQPQLAAEIAIVCLVALVWFAGPWIGLESVDTRIQTIIGIIVLRAGVYVVRHQLARKRAERLEASLRQGTPRGRSEKREDLEAVRVQFEKGIAALKDSQLGNGKAALYALPWYMFIGPPASGKSTALRHSGLQFPALGRDGQGLQGLGGTRNCDWWFTNAGVLLDTAGRYVTQAEDQDEWLAFLDLLKKYRGQKPLNGVIATISIADVIQGSDEEVQEHAKHMRARIDELIKRLGVVCPVYVMFTKCDLVQGFVDFFDELNRTERERIWGCTFAKSDHSNRAPGATFTREFDRLLSVLHERRLIRLSTTRGSQKVSIFGFPMQLALAGDRLARFIDTLFHGNAYQESPLFRGFYFTSGTQEGTPIDRILGVVSRASGLSDMNLGTVMPTEPKSYFLKELFSDIIFPDQHLVSPSSMVFRQRGYLRVVALGLSVVFALVTMVGLSISFLGNKRLLNGILSASLQPPDFSLDPGQLPQSIDYIGELGDRFKELLEIEQRGVPLHLAEFYQGYRLRDEVGEVYFRYFSKLFLEETKRDMEERLSQIAVTSAAPGSPRGEFDEQYALLKAYLMLGDPAHLKPEYLSRWLTDHWGGKLKEIFRQDSVSAELQEKVFTQMYLYSQYLARNHGERLALHVRLVKEVQSQLRQVPRMQRIYALSKREAEDLVKPFTIDLVLQGPLQGTITSEYEIPGVYTMAGWKGPFQASVAKILEESGDEGWIIGEPEVELAQLDKGIKRQYFQDYVRHWREFLRSLRIKPVVTPSNVDEELSLLASGDSPIQRVFEAVVQNTVPGPEGLSKLQETATGILGKIKQQLGIEGTSAIGASVKDTEELIRRLADPNDFSGSVTLRFKGLDRLLHVAKDAKEDAPLIKYLTDVRKVQQTVRPILRAESPAADMKALAESLVAGKPNDILLAMNGTDALLQKLDPETREIVAPLLIEPWIMTMKGVLERAKSEAAKRWEAEVYPACLRNVEGRYPFRQVGGDAPIADLSEVFHPENGLLWKFYQAELKPFIAEGADRWELKQWANVSMNLSEEFLSSLTHARLLSESLFPRGSMSPGISFEVYPHPVLGGVKSATEIRLEVGGQTLRYQNGPQEWEEVKWPGPTPAAGALLQVQVNGTWITREVKDLWGLFRLIEAGRVSSIAGDAQYRVQWDLPAADGQAVKVQYDLRTSTHKNPFRPGLFEQFRCVAHL